jgi:[methyl-Co(III) methanol-specific corrinoid protein]:coenzyme M methyltransferase
MMKKPEDVLAEAKRAAEIGFDIVTPECGVPPQTPNENLMALAHYREH